MSANHGNIRRVEKQVAGLPEASRPRYALGLSSLQVLGFTSLTLLPFGPTVRGRALQTTYCWPFCSRVLARKVHGERGAVHSFITKFGPIQALDGRKGQLTEKALFKVLRREVDGIMTDRPGEVRPLLDKWINDPSVR